MVDLYFKVGTHTYVKNSGGIYIVYVGKYDQVAIIVCTIYYIRTGYANVNINLYIFHVTSCSFYQLSLNFYFQEHFFWHFCSLDAAFITVQ